MSSGSRPRLRRSSGARGLQYAQRRIAGMTVQEILERARAFAEQELRPVALQYDESEEFPRKLLDRAAEQGLTCYDLPEAYGGGGVDRLADQIQVIEELTWGDSPIALVVAQGGFFARPLLPMGREEQKQRWLPRVCSERPPACAVAITEPGAGSDAAAIATTAWRVDGGYVLDGHKKFIGNAPVVDLCVVFATVEPGSRSKGVTAFV